MFYWNMVLGGNKYRFYLWVIYVFEHAPEAGVAPSSAPNSKWHTVSVYIHIVSVDQFARVANVYDNSLTHFR